MKEKMLCAFLGVLILMCSGCTKEDAQTKMNTDKTENSEITDCQIDYSEYYPPIMPWAENAIVPDFLNEEQQLLYRRAMSIFPIFTGSPHVIHEFPKKDSGMPPEINELNELDYREVTIDGREFSAFGVIGKYENFNEFENMVLSVYTEEYYKSESWNCMNIDGKLYILETARGGMFGYRPDFCPDTFEIISMSENEIEFYLIAHYYDTYYPDIEAGEQPVLSKKYPIKMVLTDDGWRVSLFNMASHAKD